MNIPEYDHIKRKNQEWGDKIGEVCGFVVAVILVVTVLAIPFLLLPDAVDKEIKFQDNVKASWVGSSVPIREGR